MCCGELASGLYGSWAEFTSVLAHPCALVIADQWPKCRLGSCRGKSLCLNAMSGRNEIARHVVMVTPRLFRHARAGHMWELCCFRLSSEANLETKY